MLNPEKALIQAYRNKLALLRDCRQLMEDKLVYLLTNDLNNLEKSLETESELAAQLVDCEQRIESCIAPLASIWKMKPEQIGWKCLSARMGSDGAAHLAELKGDFESVVEEIRILKVKNLALVENGRLFSQTLLNVICPPQTYQPGANTPQMPSQTRLSVQY